ncbi:MAG: DUF3006 domain-containing protein [Eubacterium sp.]|nr:DUF3006 domain-containing protein [Eubacterium sp.]
MLIIDRFEEDYAVVEDDEVMINIPRSMLSEDCAEGDVIYEFDDVYLPDKEKTRELREETLRRLKRLGL